MKLLHSVLTAVIKTVVPDPKLGCEVGVWRGETSAYLLSAFPSLTMLMVDRYAVFSEAERLGGGSLGVKTGEEMVAAMSEALVRTDQFALRRLFVVGDSPSVASVLSADSLDFAFIDACHLYEAVCADIRAWYPRVKRGGILCGHDYGGLGDKRGWFGVRRAVDEFCSYVNVELHVERYPSLVWWLQRPQGVTYGDGLRDSVYASV